jgi:hypothetical protein
MIIIISLTKGSQVAGQDFEYSLLVNKHYFSVGEQIYFSMYKGSSNLLPSGWPLYFSLLKVYEDHQELKRAVKVRWDGIQSHGYLPISDDLTSGEYILGVFPYPLSVESNPWKYTYLYVYNPIDDEKDIPYPDKKMDDNKGVDLPDNQNMASNKISLNYKLEEEQSNGSRVTFIGNLTSGNQIPVQAEISVSVVEQRFYDSGQSNFIDSRHLPGFQNWPFLNPAIKKDSVLKESKYLHGKLLIDGDPAPLKKIYFFSLEDTLLILDNYITDQEGNFRFQEPSVADSYSLKLLTLPEGEKQYHFELLNRLFRDSLYRLNIPYYKLKNIPEFRNYASKKYLIDQSYLTLPIKENEDSSVRLLMDAKLSHVIYLDDYVPFSTLAEIIREIVPQVSVKYHQGTYEIRIFDARAKNYCCNDNPLILVNQEPFVDPGEVMKINTADIKSIEVIRPIEAIRSFGDIGVNGILRINLRSEIPVPALGSRGKASYQIPGFQSEKRNIAQELPDDYPDFRNFLYWDGKIETDPEGKFEFQFHPSKLTGNYIIAIKGITTNSDKIDEKIVFNLPGEE